MKQETKEKLSELIEIAIKEAVEESRAEEQTPVTIPLPPEGAVILGRGGQFKIPNDAGFEGWSIAASGGKKWHYSSWFGNCSDVYYAAPYNSEIAKLNFGEKLEDDKEVDIPKECLPLPEGARFLGKGNHLKRFHFKGWMFNPQNSSEGWIYGIWECNYPQSYYAAPENSDVFIFNGFAKEKDLQPGQPSLANAVYLGRGGDFYRSDCFAGWVTRHCGDGKWWFSPLQIGISPNYHYAAPKDSFIAKLNPSKS